VLFVKLFAQIFEQNEVAAQRIRSNKFDRSIGPLCYYDVAR